MRFTNTQLEWLSKMANDGRLIVRPITAEPVPEWAKHEFLLAKQLLRELFEMKRLVPAEILEKSASTKMRRYQKAASKGWKTRRALASARQAMAENNERGRAA
jgi:hypothetical protein